MSDQQLTDGEQDGILVVIARLGLALKANDAATVLRDQHIHDLEGQVADLQKQILQTQNELDGARKPLRDAVRKASTAKTTK